MTGFWIENCKSNNFFIFDNTDGAKPFELGKGYFLHSSNFDWSKKII